MKGAQAVTDSDTKNTCCISMELSANSRGFPACVIFDESMRVKGPIPSTPNRKFGWFGWHIGYQSSRDNTKEIEKGWIVKGDTLADLAVKLEMKPDDLEETIAKYNGLCKYQVDAEFGGPKKAWWRLKNRHSIALSSTRPPSIPRADPGGIANARSSIPITSRSRDCTARASWVPSGVGDITAAATTPRRSAPAKSQEGMWSRPSPGKLPALPGDSKSLTAPYFETLRYADKSADKRRFVRRGSAGKSR